MKRSNRAVLAVVLTAAGTHLSCGSHDPARVDRPPVVESFAPAGRVLTGFVGDTLQFAIHASDPDRDRLATSYLVDGAWTFDGAVFDYAVEDTGRVEVRARVSDGSHTSYIDWSVERLVPVNFPPSIETTLPVEPNPVLVIGNRIDFAVIASDPERETLAYTYSVNDSLVAWERQFTYEATSLGTKRVLVRVSDGGNSDVHEWLLKVTTVPDAIPPAPVVITRAETGTEPGEVYLEWTAVGRDGMVGKPSLYQVRTSPAPILTEADWARGSDRPGVPAPAPAGETMQMVVGGLQPARPTYIAVRATDDFGNISAIQPPVQVVTRGMRFGGRVVDTVTGQGLANAIVTFGNVQLVTASDGTFEFTEQGYGSGVIAARDEQGAEIGAYYDYDMEYSVEHLDVVNMYLIPNRPLQTTYYTDFLNFFRVMTDVGGIPYPADQRRRDLPIGLFCRPYVKDGLDYAETIRAVAQEYDAILGTMVFVPASDPLPAERVETAYNTTLQRDRYTVLEWTPDYYPLSGLIEFRTHYTPSVVEPFKVIIRHEIGHSLGLGHSLDPKHLMVGGPAPSVPTLTGDEIAVLRTYYTIPRGWNVRRYQRN
jgi:hypothetical protein